MLYGPVTIQSAEPCRQTTISVITENLKLIFFGDAEMHTKYESPWHKLEYQGLVHGDDTMMQHYDKQV